MQKGFSLIELAGVLIIVGIMLGYGLTAAEKVAKQKNIEETKAEMAEIAEALRGYAAEQFNNDGRARYPCPARLDLVPSETAGSQFGIDVTVGTGACTTGTGVFSILGVTTSVYYGAVPVRALNLSDNYAADAWGNKYSYAVTQAFVNGNTTGGNGEIIINAGNLTTNYQKIAGTDKAAYAIISHGRTATGAYPLKATTRTVACPNPATTTDHENCDFSGAGSDATLYDAFFNEGSTAEFFDDLIIWKKLDTFY